MGVTVAFSCLVLGAKKAYSWTELGLRFAGFEQQTEELRILAREWVT